MTSLKPLIAICGTTGVGKSKLGVELALKLSHEMNRESQDTRSSHQWRGARIINADSMQVYIGMDVITNKVPQPDRMGVEHLLMDFKHPGEQYVVGQWVQDAIQVIEETHNRGQIPIVVGGTSYWIQHLLFPNRLTNKDLSSTPRDPSTPDPIMLASLERAISQLPSDLLDLWRAIPTHPPNAATHPEDALSLHKLLHALDDPVASRWHWRDTRKVLRSLQIMKETGRRPSELISEQSESPLIPRYPTLCFWLYAEPSALNPRLDERVDDMIKQGLLDEIRALRKIASSSLASAPSSLVEVGQQDNLSTSLNEPDYTLGIYQCIGFKEFRDFLSSPGASQETFANAVEEMKHSTRRYAKRQIAWLRNKLLPAIHSANASVDREAPAASMYLLDATVLGDHWTSNVLFPAQSIMNSFLQGEELPNPASLSPAAKVILTNANKPVNPSAVLQARRRIVCPVCTTNPSQPVMIEGQEWDAHRGTRVHRRLVARAKRESEGFPSRCYDRNARETSSGDESNNSSESLHLPS
ncbi:tRNA isopentenyltransferase [Melanogaster broomeanus]|nr:tRNA isopentenyltransferase [Melanogaster broomeanus]